MASACERQLLLIDDRTAEVRLLKAVATRAGWRSLCATDPGDALALIRRPANRPDAILLPWNDGSGAQAIALLAARGITPAPIVLARSPTELAAALRAGAGDVLIEPVSAERLLAALQAIEDQASGPLRLLTEKIVHPATFDRLVGAAPGFLAAIDAGRRAAEAVGPVLIEGEAGVGKEAFARAIHAASPRADRPLAIINCRTVPRNLIDSELFGHEQGAFPGAFERRVGRVVAAQGGSVFLDEVTALPAESQQRLLRLVGAGEVRPLGSNIATRVDVRVLAAVDGQLASAIKAGGFDATLGRVLAANRLAIPSLAERRADIPMLAQELLALIHFETNAGPNSLSPEAAALLRDQDWAGNVHQLQSALLRLGARTAGPVLDVSDMAGLRQAQRPERAEPGAEPVSLFDPSGHLRPLEAIEADVIRLAIGHYSGRMSEVARRLGIGRSTLYRKLGDLGIQHDAA
jgi:DNA-binding NtrC family response regulator